MAHKDSPFIIHSLRHTGRPTIAIIWSLNVTGNSTMKSDRSRSLKNAPIDRSCVTMPSSKVCFVSKRLASTSFRRQVLGTPLVQRWCGLSGNVRLPNLLISSCFIYPMYSTLSLRGLKVKVKEDHTPEGA